MCSNWNQRTGSPDEVPESRTERDVFMFIDMAKWTCLRGLNLGWGVEPGTGVSETLLPVKPTLTPFVISRPTLQAHWRRES